MSETRFPYEYGSPLHWLWGWGKRLNDWLKDNQSPRNEWLTIVLSPDRLAEHAMMTFSVEFAYVIGKIDESLKLSESLHDRLMASDEPEVVEQHLGDAMTTLRDRIWDAAAIIAETRKELGRSTQETKDSVNWTEARDRLEAMHDRGAVYTSQHRLAEQLGCSPATVSKAFFNSVKLKGWMLLATNPKATDLTELVTDNVQQTREIDPSEVTPEEDIDAALAQVLDVASPEEKVEIHRMDAHDQQELAKTYLKDPGHWKLYKQP